MLHICCIRAGTAFAPAYVDILFDSVRRNLAEGFEGDFTVFTDQPDKLAKGIIVRPLPADLPGWWSKLALHKDWLFPHGDRVLFFDLDTVITGRIDELAAYDGPFATLRDYYRPDGLQSAVMAWKAGETSDIWRSYEAAGCPQDVPGGDQAWIEQCCLAHDREYRLPKFWEGDILSHAPGRKVGILQDVFPCLFVSYKADNLRNHPPAKASVVVFHGKPRPSDVLTGWVPQVWKVGGMSRADLDTVCNVEADALTANIRSAITLDVPWFDTAPEHDGHVCIVGGGPSLESTLDELQWRQSMGQEIWALNGAAHFLHARGIIADALVIADAREENKAFLPGAFLPDFTTRLYLASQCHPALFEKAELLDLDVTLWHVNSEGTAELLAGEKDKPVHLIGGGSTVGLNAMVLAFARGYRKIHLYGFDSSYREDSHHAYPQSLNDNDRVIDALYGDRKFKTAPWMAQQVNEFQDLAISMTQDGCTITVAGYGLLPTVARDMAHSMPMSPAQIRAHEVLKRVEGNNLRGVEVGVFAGEMSAALLRMNSDLHLDMVDSWEGSGAAYDGDSGDWHAELAQDSQDAFMQQAQGRTAFAGDRAVIVRKRSTEAASDYADVSLDFVFLDADHGYQGCKADIEAWASKVKPGGWLCGHDFENTNFPKFGVTQAVTEYLQRTGLSLDLGENLTWFVQMLTT